MAHRRLDSNTSKWVVDYIKELNGFPSSSYTPIPSVPFHIVLIASPHNVLYILIIATLLAGFHTDLYPTFIHRFSFFNVSFDQACATNNDGHHAPMAQYDFSFSLLSTSVLSTFTSLLLVMILSAELSEVGSAAKS